MNKECCGSPNTCEKPCFHGGKGSVLDVQIGGNHYKNAAIQPIQFIVANNIPYREANVIKYVFRHASKNGKQDLLKARHYIDMLIEEYEGGGIE